MPSLCEGNCGCKKDQFNTMSMEDLLQLKNRIDKSEIKINHLYNKLEILSESIQCMEIELDSIDLVKQTACNHCEGTGWIKHE